MASAPAYTATPKTPYCQIATANTGRDGTGTVGTVHTAGASGSRIGSVTVTATGTTTAGTIRLFVSNDGGTTKRLIDEIMVIAVTPSTTVRVFTATWTPPGGALQLVATNGVLYAATHNAETFNVFANQAGDY